VVIGARRSLKPRTHASRVAPGTPMGAVRTGLHHAETETGKLQAEPLAGQKRTKTFFLTLGVKIGCCGLMTVIFLMTHGFPNIETQVS
jgi:hypothetical protein